MTKRTLSILILVALLPLGIASAQEGGLTLVLDADNAVIWHGEEGTYDGKYTDPGAVTFHAGEFHMFRNGFDQWPGWVGIAYHTSADGDTWTQHGDGPVLTTDDVPFAVTAALATSVLVEDDGTWVLYFYTWGNQFSDNPAAWSIGRATAADPAGPWAVDPEPVLLPGAAGEWDGGQVDVPSVVKTDDGYVMYYSGHAEPGNNAGSMIGMATSADGITWTRHPNNPVLTLGDNGAWDSFFVQHPRVVRTPDGWVMSYRSFSSGGSDKAYGLATSADGVTWTKRDDNPYLFNKDLQRRGMWFHTLVYADGTLHLFVELQRGYQNETDIYAGTLEGSLFP
jgi:predicted GH43/DUF377 family glycosyl hydrolase